MSSATHLAKNSPEMGVVEQKEVCCVWQWMWGEVNCAWLCGEICRLAVGHRGRFALTVGRRVRFAVPDSGVRFAVSDSGAKFAVPDNGVQSEVCCASQWSTGRGLPCLVPESGKVCCVWQWDTRRGLLCITVGHRARLIGAHCVKRLANAMGSHRMLICCITSYYCPFQPVST